MMWCTDGERRELYGAWACAHHRARLTVDQPTGALIECRCRRVEEQLRDGARCGPPGDVRVPGLAVLAAATGRRWDCAVGLDRHAAPRVRFTGGSKWAGSAGPRPRPQLASAGTVNVRARRTSPTTSIAGSTARGRPVSRREAPSGPRSRRRGAVARDDS